jgi:hypothetical protein
VQRLMRTSSIRTTRRKSQEYMNPLSYEPRRIVSAAPLKVAFLLTAAVAVQVECIRGLGRL